MNLILSKKIYDLKEIPEKTGIYFFMDFRNFPIYIGKSINLNKRIRQHLNSKKNKSLKLKSRYDHIRFLETKSELIALLIESQEIKRNNPIFNRKLRKKRENISVNISKDENGFSVLNISKEKNNSLSSFQSIKKAKSFINYISEKYELCKKLNSIHLQKHCCYAITSKHNTHSCYCEESFYDYNLRFKKMEEDMIFPKNKFLIVDKKHQKPYPFVSVDNGTIEGYGYTNDPFFINTHLRKLDYTTKDETIIVKNYYKKNRDSIKLINSK